jgi:hypothetical protein
VRVGEAATSAERQSCAVGLYRLIGDAVTSFDVAIEPDRRRASDAISPPPATRRTDHESGQVLEAPVD